MENKKDIVYGINESKQVIDFAIALGLGIHKSLDDKQFTLTDLPNFMPALITAIPALDNVDLVSLEFMDLKPEEAEELKAYVRNQLKLEDGKDEEFIEDAFAVVLSIFMLVKSYFKTELPVDEDATKMENPTE